MPLMDMSAALAETQFQDSFTVVQRQQVVSNAGIGSMVATNFPNVSGVVYPSDENDLQRLPDYSIQMKAFTVFTQFALRGESEAEDEEFEPDILLWNGDSFLVRTIEDYSNFGAGFVKAICTSTDYVDQAPKG
jgi:galactose-6-phosphate isomerase